MKQLIISILETNNEDEEYVHFIYYSTGGAWKL